MAANEYYNTGPPPAAPAHTLDTSHPLPPAPPLQHTISAQSISPPTSPYDNNRYDYPSNTNLIHTKTGGAASSHYSGDTAYQGPGGGASNTPPAYPYGSHGAYDSPHDPFADQNAIPLKNQGHGNMGEGGYGMADPEARYPQQGGYPPHGDVYDSKKKGFLKKKHTWVVYLLTAVQLGVFIAELVKNGVLTGSPIQTKPSFNIMIGPSSYVMINMGARYQPCMHYIKKVVDADPAVTGWPCPNTTTTTNASVCSLSELCGMGGVPDQVYNFTFAQRAEHKSMEPNQWYRFITPIFLHAGIIHIGFNMLLQWTLGRDMEKEIGSLRFTLVYFSAGIFGFVLGGNYAGEGLASVGASGSLFGILALNLLDLLYHWSTRRSPMKDLLFLLLDVAISFVLGLLPGLDNFSHIGGFLMGLVLGVCILHSPQALRERIGVNDPPYATVANPALPTMSGANGAGDADSDSGHIAARPAKVVGGATGEFIKKPLSFFKGRKPFWWMWWALRAAMLVVTLIGFVLLLRNFYDWRNGCSWCHHLTCLPISTNGVNWCDIGNLNIT